MDGEGDAEHTWMHMDAHGRTRLHTDPQFHKGGVGVTEIWAQKFNFIVMSL